MKESDLLAMTLDDIYINCTKVIPELITSKFYWKGTLVSMLLQNYLMIFLQRDEKSWERISNCYSLYSHITSKSIRRKLYAYLMVDCLHVYSVLVQLYNAWGLFFFLK